MFDGLFQVSQRRLGVCIPARQMPKIHMHVLRIPFFVHSELDGRKLQNRQGRGGSAREVSSIFKYIKSYIMRTNSF